MSDNTIIEIDALELQQLRDAEARLSAPLYVHARDLLDAARDVLNTMQGIETSDVVENPTRVALLIAIMSSRLAYGVDRALGFSAPHTGRPLKTVKDMATSVG